MKKVLTIAGSDCSGGAGIQADLKTIMAHGCYGMSVITAITAQNTKGISMVEKCSKEIIKSQLDAIFQDIMPDAVKIGMMSSASTIESVVEKLKLYNPKNIVLDPVLISTSGTKLLDEDAIAVLKNELFPIVTLITPNVDEAEYISGIKIIDKKTVEESAKKLREKYACNVLIKGGHLKEEPHDFLITEKEEIWYEGKRIQNKNTHGTGCTLSSSIASNLALGYEISESVKKSKEYINGAIASNLNIGEGRGPLNHSYMMFK